MSANFEVLRQNPKKEKRKKEKKKMTHSRPIAKIILGLLILFSAKVYGQATPDINKLDDAVGVVLCYDASENYLGHGSCFIIDADGVLVTNYHVLSDVYSAKIKLEDGSLYDLDKIISGNKDIDLIKFSIKKKYVNQKFPFVKIAKSLPNKGEHALAIGTPTSLSHFNTVSEGLISNIHPDGILIWKGTMLQINAGITHGSSGGALFNNKGELIGVTCGGDPGEDAARASINYAVWIGELTKLNYLNVDRIYNDALIPVKVSFYITYLSYNNDVALAVDGKYIGTFSSYFNQGPAVCDQQGTITVYLAKGYHSYLAYERSTGGMWSGNFTINTNDCLVKGLNNTPQPRQQTYTPQREPRTPRPPRPAIENKYKYKWMLSVALSPFYVNTAVATSYVYANSNSNHLVVPVSIFLERYFSTHKISLRANYQYLRTNQKYSVDELTNYGLKYSSYGLDIKRIFTKDNRYWNWFIAGSVNVRSYVKDYSQAQFINNGVYDTKYIDSVKTTIGFAPLFRTGAEIHITKRFCFAWDTGIGFNTATSLPIMEYNFMLGYRLFAKKEN